MKNQKNDNWYVREYHSHDEIISFTWWNFEIEERVKSEDALPLEPLKCVVLIDKCSYNIESDATADQC